MGKQWTPWWTLLNEKPMVKQHKILPFPLQPELRYLSCLLFPCLLRLMGLRGEGPAAKRLSVKHGKSAETRDSDIPGERKDFSPRDDQEDVLFLQKKCWMKYFSRSL